MLQRPVQKSQRLGPHSPADPTSPGPQDPPSREEHSPGGRGTTGTSRHRRFHPPQRCSEEEAAGQSGPILASAHVLVFGESTRHPSGPDSHHTRGWDCVQGHTGGRLGGTS